MSPTYSIIIPACNEELFIGQAIASVDASIAHANPDATYEIIVVLNRCTDRTREISLSLGAKVTENDAKNLSIIRNAGAAVAEGQVIVTLDADSRVALNMFSEISKALADPQVVGGGTIIWPERWSLGIMLTGLFLLPAVAIDRISGGLFFVRKQDFDAIGGFDESLVSAEDIDFARRLKKFSKQSGRRFITLWRSKIITSCRKFDRFGDWFFLKNPLMVYRLLKGQDRRYADLVWYDFHRKPDDHK